MPTARVRLVLLACALTTACGGGGDAGGAGPTPPSAPAPVATVTLSVQPATLVVGDTAQLSVALRDASGQPLTGRSIAYASSAADVAAVDATGRVVGVAAGSAALTATSEGRSGTLTIAVAPAPVATIAVAPATLALTVGETRSLVASLQDARGRPLTGRTVVWSSSDAATARVDASGTVVAVAPGAATITATSEGRSASAAVTVQAVPVASIDLTPATATVPLGGHLQLVAVVRDAAGTPLAGRTITWASSAPALVSVSSTGNVTALAAGGPVTITATSEGRSATTRITVPFAVLTGITDLRAFLDACPTADSAIARIRGDFELRVDGAVVTAPVPCAGTMTALPIAQLTDELIALQVLRTAYYMSKGTAGHLPWTTKSLYDWMRGDIAGVNIKTAPGQLYCCDEIGGKRYFSTSRQDAAQRDVKRTWIGISSSLNFFAHEIRHVDAGAPGHVNGCPAFPQPSDPLGCDPSYEVANLGAYGVQYWLESAWATGYLDIGIACAGGALAQQYAAWDASSANGFRDRFVTSVPPPVVAQPPFGGACIAP